MLLCHCVSILIRGGIDVVMNLYNEDDGREVKVNILFRVIEHMFLGSRRGKKKIKKIVEKILNSQKEVV